MSDPDSRRSRVEDFILERLALLEQCEVDELRERLLADGAEMPYDSVVLVELMTTVEEHFGVRLPLELATARDMRAIGSFARRVCEELDAGDADGPSPVTAWTAAPHGDGIDDTGAEGTPDRGVAREGEPT
ncbi:hypothetical protein [Saccharothrix hoggarensis]|uniref:Acyl carrier protein n=1 Tax=Saccharothrix hoggarensis TaxID=913853 RepID=A0ABW3QM07_9PSEU